VKYLHVQNSYVLEADVQTALLRELARLGQAHILRQVPEGAHVRVGARRISQGSNRLNERGGVQESVHRRVEGVAGDRRTPAHTCDVRAVGAVEDRERSIGGHGDGKTAAVSLSDRDPPTAQDLI